MNRKTTTVPATITLLDKGCEFHGKLSFEGVVRIDGIFQGEIFSHDHLIIGEGASVEANIQVGKLEVGGNFNGDIVAREQLVVHPTGRIRGNIQAKELEVQEGAVIDGQLDMSSVRDAVAEPKETVVRFDTDKSSKAIEA